MDSEKITAGVRPAEWYEKENQEKTDRPARAYTVSEKVCAWGMIVLGYGFFRAFPVYKYPLGGLLLLAALFGVTLVTLTKNGHPVKGMALAVCLSALPVSLSLFFADNSMIHTAAFFYALTAYAYTVYAACGNTLEEGLSDLLPMDLLRAVFVLPFTSLSALLSAIGGGSGFWKKSGMTLLRILFGLSFAIIPAMIAVSLLSYDSHFRSRMDDLFSLRLGDVFGHLTDLVLGVFLAMLFFGLYVSADEHRCGRLTPAVCRESADRMHSFSPVTACSAVCPILFIYGVFFFSQWENYVSAFHGTLPENILYSEYAREGFFELCAVSFLNLLLLTATGMFTRRTETRRAHLSVRILHGVLSGCTLVLIATAVSKMMLYIEAYGLTPKRVYATWFMAVLTLVFLLVIVKQFVPGLKLIALSMAVCVAMFALLGLANVEGQIAAYNADRYLAGTLEDPALEGLGAASIPARIRLGDWNYNADSLCDNASEFFGLTLPRIRARAAEDRGQ